MALNLCKRCKGLGFIDVSKDLTSACETVCPDCNGYGHTVRPNTNGDLIRQCTNEQLVQVIFNLRQSSIYSSEPNRRLLFDTTEDMTEWINKSADDLDYQTIFPFLHIDN